MKSRVLLILAASLALAGCPDKPADKTAAQAPKVAPPAATPPATATPTPSASAPPVAAQAAAACTGACNVTVEITSDGKTCTVGAPSMDPINVGRSPQPTIIKWTLTGANGFKFAQSPGGIVFDKGPAPPSGVMQNGQGGAPVATVTDNHKDETTKGSWRYSIYVTSNDGKITCKRDPSVDNN